MGVFASVLIYLVLWVVAAYRLSFLMIACSIPAYRDLVPLPTQRRALETCSTSLRAQGDRQASRSGGRRSTGWSSHRDPTREKQSQQQGREGCLKGQLACQEPSLHMYRSLLCRHPAVELVERLALPAASFSSHRLIGRVLCILDKSARSQCRHEAAQCS